MTIGVGNTGWEGGRGAGGAYLQQDGLGVLIFQFHPLIKFHKRGAIDDVNGGGGSYRERVR